MQIKSKNKIRFKNYQKYFIIIFTASVICFPIIIISFVKCNTNSSTEDYNTSKAEVFAI